MSRMACSAGAVPPAEPAAIEGSRINAADLNTPLVLPPCFKESYVELAHQLAEAAANVTRKYFRCERTEEGWGVEAISSWKPGNALPSWGRVSVQGAQGRVLSASGVGVEEG